ncbi:MAG: recombinase family protein [Parvibaculaceae bacterium]
MVRDSQPPRTRCAIYTRKSSEEGLEQAFNSLHAQREACEAYIMSQRHEGWTAIPTLYDDGGFSGGTLERPALRALLAEIKAGQVDVVVVYKVDRLTRSLFDFAKIVEIFDVQKVSFVSVTQSFNTTTSMGRLTLNVLLSFAQFEREVTGERIRDKVAASKKKGMWMGGNVPLGYDIKDRKLAINESEAKIVRVIFDLYQELGSVRKLKVEVDRLGLKTKARSSDKPDKAHDGLPFRIGHLYTILRNPLYIGQVHHKGEAYDGEHPAIIGQDIWDGVQRQLASNAVSRRSGHSSKEPSLLAGLIYDGNGDKLTPTHAVKGGKRYRYYITNKLIAGRGARPEVGLRLPAHEVEGHVVQAICRFLADPQKLSKVIGQNDELPSTQIKTIASAKSLSEKLDDETSPDRYLTIRELIQEVRVLKGSIRLVLDRRSLEQRLGIIDQAQQSSGDLGREANPIVVELSAELKRLGREKRLVVAAHAPDRNPDPVLIKAIARAHRWFEMLKTGQVASITEIAKRENTPRTYASRIIPLAFLAPDITVTILEGRQPIELTLDHLLNAMPLPLGWDEQRKVLGL